MSKTIVTVADVKKAFPRKNFKIVVHTTGTNPLLFKDNNSLNNEEAMYVGYLPAEYDRHENPIITLKDVYEVEDDSDDEEIRFSITDQRLKNAEVIGYANEESDDEYLSEEENEYEVDLNNDEGESINLVKWRNAGHKDDELFHLPEIEKAFIQYVNTKYNQNFKSLDEIKKSDDEDFKKQFEAETWPDGIIVGQFVGEDTGGTSEENCNVNTMLDGQNDVDSKLKGGIWGAEDWTRESGNDWESDKEIMDKMFNTADYATYSFKSPFASAEYPSPKEQLAKFAKELDKNENQSMER